MRHMYTFRKERGTTSLLWCGWERLYGGAGIGAAVLYNSGSSLHTIVFVNGSLWLLQVDWLGFWMGPWRIGGIWMDGRGVRVYLVGINKVLSEEGEASQLAGELFALRMSRQALRLQVVPGICCFPVTESWVEWTFWCNGYRSGGNACVLFPLSSLRIPCVWLGLHIPQKALCCDSLLVWISRHIQTKHSLIFSTIKKFFLYHYSDLFLLNTTFAPSVKRRRCCAPCPLLQLVQS